MWNKSGFGRYEVTTKNQPSIWSILDIFVSQDLNRENPNVRETCSPGLPNLYILQGRWRYKILLPINVHSHFCNSEQNMAAMET